VVIPSHGRRLRLRWLLNALEDQTLDPDAFEVIVAHDYEGDDERLIETHPLSAAGRLRSLQIGPGTGPAQKRNLGWRAARAPLVAFVDDDCRPDAEWLEQLIEAAEANPGAIVQGAVRPDPFELKVASNPHYRTVRVTPPHDFAQTANIAYPRVLLERVDGFDEGLPTPAGEDTDLALRARATGAPMVGAADAIVFHAVEAFSLRDALRLAFRWQHLGFVVKRHPQLRKHLTHRIFWRRTHRDMALLLVGVVVTVAFGFLPALLLAVPWVYRRITRRGRHKRALAAGVIELPGGFVVDVAEVVSMCVGSVRYRTLML
jgi:GT2 family glycosyltransferase